MEKEHRASEKIYLDVRRGICRSIFAGDYEDGDLIPSERKLAEELGVSRVSVRSALELLEQERIITRVRGSGTRVSLFYGPRRGTMDIITVVAPAQNGFFSSLIDAVQTKADSLDSLVLFQQKPKGVPLDKCLYRIYEKGLRNLVLWKEDMSLPEEIVRKLKGLGMNIVLFDAVDGGKYADAVCLDNADAVRILFRRLSDAGCRKFAYVGWDNPEIGSLRLRENTFRSLSPEGRVFHVPYLYHNQENEKLSGCLQEAAGQLREYDGVIYAVGELGIVCESIGRNMGLKHQAGMIGMARGARELGIHVVEQDFRAMSDKIFDCLTEQNTEGSGWTAGTYALRGIDLGCGESRTAGA